MSTGISSSDFVGQWSLSFADIDFINSKPGATRLGLAAQLKFFSARGFFADDGTLVPHDAAEYLAEQIGVRADELSSYDFGGRTGRRHCAEILRYLGFRRMTRGDREALSRWIIGELCPSGQSVSAMLEAVFHWCRDHNICQRRRKTRPLGGAKPGQYSRHAGKRREGVARAVLACVRGDFRRTVQADWPDFRALL